MNVVNNPGFETATDWAYGGGAQRRADAALTGDWGGFCGWRTGFFGTPTIGDVNLTLVIGRTYRVRVQIAYSGANHDYLDASIDDGGGSYAQQGYTEELGDGAAVFWNLGSFVATGTTGKIRFRCGNTSHDLQGWLIDDVLVIDTGADVAVKLAERAIDAVVLTLQDNLAVELTSIDAERADGVTMLAPRNADYYKRPVVGMKEYPVQVEAFEASYEFFNFYTDTAAERAAYELPVTLRLTFTNVEGESPDGMMVRMRRYSAGMFNVFNKNPMLGDTDDAIKIVEIQRITPTWEIESEDTNKEMKAQLTFDLNVKCEEVQS